MWESDLVPGSPYKKEIVHEIVPGAGETSDIPPEEAAAAAFGIRSSAGDLGQRARKGERESLDSDP